MLHKTEISLFETTALPAAWVHALERMRAMRPHRKLKLEQKFVRRQSLRVTGALELPANLAELARPVSQDQRSPGVDQLRVVEATGMVVACTEKPSARDLVFSGNVEARRGRKGLQRLFGTVPDVLETAHQRVVNRAPQRLPAHRGVHAIELVDQGLSDRRMAPRIGNAQIDIGGLGDVPIGAQVFYGIIRAPPISTLFPYTTPLII